MKKLALHSLWAILAITLASFSFPLVAAADAPLTVSALDVYNITPAGATVSWTTSVATDSVIIYTKVGGSTYAAGQRDSTRTHTVSLNNFLLPNSQYEVRAETTYLHQNYTSQTARFTTLPLPRLVPFAPSNPVIITNVINTLTLNTPATGNLTSTSVKIFWGTNNPSDSHVQYYADPAHLLSAGQDDSVTNHIVAVSGLSPGTTYSYRVKSKDASGIVQSSPVYTFRTLTQLIGALDPRTDTTRPVITNIRVSPSPVRDTATITWQTDEDASSQVFYSTTATTATRVWDYEYTAGTDLRDRTQTHSITLAELAPGTTYSFRVVSGNISQLFGVSNRNTFITAGSAAPVPAPANAPIEVVNPPLGASSQLQTQNENPPALQTIEAVGSTSPEEAVQPESEPVAPAPSNSSAEIAFENAKQPLLEGLKQEQQTTDTPAVESSSIVARLPFVGSLIKGIHAQAIPWQVYIGLAILAVGFVAWLLVRRKTLLGKTAAPEMAESPPKPWSAIKISAVLAGGIFCLILLASLAPFLPQLVYYLPIYFSHTQNDRALEQAFQEKLDAAKESSIPVAQVAYTDVPDSVKQMTVDCNALEIIPEQFRGLRYDCQNMYLTSPQQLKEAVSAQKSERILLYGQYSYYDCPVVSPTVSDMIGGCLSAAKFLDNWQIPQMIRVVGVEPTKKIYYHFTQTPEEAGAICKSLGAQEAEACASPDGQIYVAAGSALSTQFAPAGEIKRAALAETFEDTKKPIVYNFTVTYPQGCFIADTHELLHFFNYQQYGAVAPAWFEEGLARLLIRPMYNQTCPPGLSFNDVSKKQGDTVTTLTNFDPDTLDVEEPLSEGLVSYAQGNQCRKGIYMQIARNIRDGGAVYIKRLYSVLQDTPPTSESTAAQAVWTSSNEDEAVKQFLSQNGCSL